MPFIPTIPSGPQEASPARLDSWKEIAAYLGRSERTAKRWESERALPVHRLPGGGRGSVYALGAELDEWLTSVKAEELGDADGAEVTGGYDLEEDAAVSGATMPQIEPPPITVSLPPPPAGGVAHGGFWRIPFLVLILAGVALQVAFLVNLRATGAHNSVNLSSRLAKADPSDAEKARAHELYLKGRYEWNQRTPDSLNRALDDFTQAIVHDPNSAEAYAGLADTYNLQRIFSTLPPGDMYPRAIAAARRAVELDDSLAEGHRALGFADVWGARNYPEGYREFRRAIELNPKDPLAHLWLANALTMGIRSPWKTPLDKGDQEMFQESLEEISKAQELDPGSHSILANKGIVLYTAGRKDEGAALLEQVERADPGLATVHTYLALVEFDRRNYPAYLAESEKSAQLHNDPALRELTGAERAGYAQGGERGLLEALFLKAESCGPATEKPRVMRAYDCVQHGENQEALQLLEEASANHEPYLAEWFSPEALPGWKAIKDEPRFQALVKKIDFPLAPGRASTSPVSTAALAPLQPADSSH